MNAIHMSPIPPRAEKKGFNPSVKEIPILRNYYKDPGEEFWKVFPQNRNLRGGTPFKMDVSQIRELAEEAGLSGPDKDLMEMVIEDIVVGADLRVAASYVPTKGKNARSAMVDGPWVTDAIAKGVKDRIYAGPFLSCPKMATVNPLQTAPKPDGKVRIILNQSSPKGKGVNQSIKKDEYPARMGGMKRILWALNHCGMGAIFFKCDYVAAYKHLHVRQKQLCYQWFMWLGRYFCELCLIFGSVSSVGIYDRMARLVIILAVLLAGFPAALAVQYLDDLCAIGYRDGVMIGRFYRQYLDVCKRIGVKLQEPADASVDKAFAPTTKGSMLGIWFCSETWMWWISTEKVSRYCNDLYEMSLCDETTQRQVWETVGKVLYVSVLIPGSKYHTSALLKANKGRDPNAPVVVTGLMKAQLLWWIDMIRLVGDGMPIPSPYNVCPVDALQGDSDAAGGTLRGGAGCGVVFRNAWAQVLWPHFMNTDAKCVCGAQFKHKLSFLEMVGHFLHVAVFARENVGKTIRTNIDNSGTVYLANKGRCLGCPLMDTLIRATNYVAVALRCKAFVVEVTRCSTEGSLAADSLSKSDFKKFFAVIPEAEEKPRKVPGSFLRWLARPTEDMELGKKVVMELQKDGVDVVSVMGKM